ncbi:MAG: GNAT family N-acetyltransferase [Candidatus Altiarchaeota archaeon]
MKTLTVPSAKKPAKAESQGLLSVPSELSFKLCSRFTAEDRALFDAGNADKVSSDVGRFLAREDNWALQHGEYDWERMDCLVAFWDDEPVGYQQFSISDDGKRGFGDGVFVEEDYHGRRISKMLREVLYPHLKKMGVETMRIHYAVTDAAVGLAESDKRDYADAIVDEGLNEALKLPFYVIGLKEFKPKYDASGITLK